MKNKLIRNLPNQNKNMMEELFKYINPVDDKWAKKIEPASKDKIESLIKLSRINEASLKFPKAYMEFLGVMGKNDGELLSGWLKADTSIDKILEVYNWIEEDSQNGIDDGNFIERKFIIAYDDISEERYMQIFKDGSNKIISGYEEMYKLGFIYDDFEKMIFFSAFEKYEKKYFSYEEKFHIEEEIQLDINLIFPMIERFAKNRGFEKVWFSDKRHLILVKSNMTMHLIRGMVINGRILGNDKKELIRLILDLKNYIKNQTII